MRERRPEVRAVDGAVARGLRGVDVFAAAAVELDALFERDVDNSDGKERLGLAQDSGAATEVTALVLLDLKGRRRGEDDKNQVAVSQ
jgi:hypothetical protein